MKKRRTNLFASIVLPLLIAVGFLVVGLLIKWSTWAVWAALTLVVFLLGVAIYFVYCRKDKYDPSLTIILILILICVSILYGLKLIPQSGEMGDGRPAETTTAETTPKEPEVTKPEVVEPEDESDTTLPANEEDDVEVVPEDEPEKEVIPAQTMTPQTTPQQTNPPQQIPQFVTTAHTHNFVLVETVYPTCTSDGKQVYKCECGKTSTTKLDKKGHAWDSGKVTKSPTCTTKGVKTYTCAECGKTKTKEIAAKGHSFAINWYSNDSYHWHECTECGKHSDESSHNWDNGKVTVKPTCDKSGQKTYTCKTCGKTRTESVAPLGHIYDQKWLSDLSSHWHECKDCHQKCDIASHNWDNGRIVRQATDKATGLKVYTCTVCGKEKSEDIPKTNPQVNPNPGSQSGLEIVFGQPSYSMADTITITVRYTANLNNLKLYLNQKELKEGKDYEVIYRGTGFISINIFGNLGTSGYVEVKAVADGYTEAVAYVQINQ